MSEAIPWGHVSGAYYIEAQAACKVGRWDLVDQALARAVLLLPEPPIPAPLRITWDYLFKGFPLPATVSGGCAEPENHEPATILQELIPAVLTLSSPAAIAAAMEVAARLGVSLLRRGVLPNTAVALLDKAWSIVQKEAPQSKEETLIRVARAWKGVEEVSTQY